MQATCYKLIILLALLLTACGSAPAAQRPQNTAVSEALPSMPQATEAPEPTAAPTTAPTVAPEPIATRAPTAPVPGDSPTYTGEGRNQTVDPAWWPCKKDQIKGNRNSKIYHIPSGRDYAKTFRDVRCFDTTQEAEAAEYRAAQR